MVVGLLICLIVGGSGVAYVAYRWFTKNNPAVGIYTMEFPEGTLFKDGIKEMEKVMESEIAVERVVRDLDLANRLEVGSEAEAAALLRERLLVQRGKEPGEVHVIYLDRSFEFSKQVLNAIHQEFVRTREARSVLRPNQPRLTP
jgi:hypothetical protein